MYDQCFVRLSFDAARLARSRSQRTAAAFCAMARFCSDVSRLARMRPPFFAIAARKRLTALEALMPTLYLPGKDHRKRLT
jgi:hypothetical protein